MIGFAECSHERTKRAGLTKAGTQRHKCLNCGKRFTHSTSTLAGMRIGVDKAEQIIKLLCEGMSVNAVSRITDADAHTIIDLLLVVGERCKRYMENVIADVQVQDVQIDELWSYIGCKERTRKRLSRPVGSCGDQYCFVGLEKHSKLVLAWHMGERTGEEGWSFVRKLKRACGSHRFQISSDGWRPYKHLIPNHFSNADYGMIIKIFTSAQDTTRYSPGQIIEVKRKRIAGNPDERRMNTSHCERFNLSIRMSIRRFTRLTNGFSKTHASHEAALGLFFMYYNFCAKHGTLKTTPAVAAGLTQERWTVAEMIERTASYIPPQRLTTLGERIEELPDE